MAFDFPASPTTGQIYQPTGGPAWQYDGEKWKGGAIAGPQKETWIDVSGKTTVDVVVPSWARTAIVTASIQPSAASALNVQISGDGTTFYTGVNYSYNGPYHQMTGPQYYTVAANSLTFWPLSGGHDNTTVPILVMAEIALQRANDANFGYTAHSSNYHTTTAYMTTWYSGYIAAAITTGVTQLKALRFLGFTAKAGSYIHIKWLGDDAQMPTQNAIPDAPSDGGEYVRVNGVWRLRAQSFDLAGKSSQDLLVPAWGPKFARVAVKAQVLSASYLTMRLSGDGTNYAAGATDYNVAGFFHHSGSGFATQSVVTQNQFFLCVTGDNVSLPLQSDTLVGLTRDATARGWTIQGWGTSYNNAATQNWETAYINGWSAAAVGGSALALKGLQVRAQGTAWTAGALNVEWLA